MDQVIRQGIGRAQVMVGATVACRPATPEPDDPVFRLLVAEQDCTLRARRLPRDVHEATTF